MLSGLRACRAEPQRGQRRLWFLWYDDQRAGFASDCLTWQPLREQGFVRHIPGATSVERIPDRLAIQPPVCPDIHDRQREEGINAGLQLDLDEIAELYVGDEDAEYEDFDHRPGGEPFNDHEYAPKVPWRIGFVETKQHVYGTAQLGQRRQNGDEDNDDCKTRHAAPHQFDGARKDPGLMDDAG